MRKGQAEHRIAIAEGGDDSSRGSFAWPPAASYPTARGADRLLLTAPNSRDVCLWLNATWDRTSPSVRAIVTPLVFACRCRKFALRGRCCDVAHTAPVSRLTTRHDLLAK